MSDVHKLRVAFVVSGGIERDELGVHTEAKKFQVLVFAMNDVTSHRCNRLSAGLEAQLSSCKEHVPFEDCAFRTLEGHSAVCGRCENILTNRVCVCIVHVKQPVSNRRGIMFHDVATRPVIQVVCRCLGLGAHSHVVRPVVTHHAILPARVECGTVGHFQHYPKHAVELYHRAFPRVDGNTRVRHIVNLVVVNVHVVTEQLYPRGSGRRVPTVLDPAVRDFQVVAATHRYRTRPRFAKLAVENARAICTDCLNPTRTHPPDPQSLNKKSLRVMRADSPVVTGAGEPTRSRGRVCHGQVQVTQGDVLHWVSIYPLNLDQDFGQRRPRLGLLHVLAWTRPVIDLVLAIIEKPLPRCRQTLPHVQYLVLVHTERSRRESQRRGQSQRALRLIKPGDLRQRFVPHPVHSHFGALQVQPWPQVSRSVPQGSQFLIRRHATVDIPVRVFVREESLLGQPRSCSHFAVDRQHPKPPRLKVEVRQVRNPNRAVTLLAPSSDPAASVQLGPLSRVGFDRQSRILRRQDQRLVQQVLSTSQQEFPLRARRQQPRHFQSGLKGYVPTIYPDYPRLGLFRAVQRPNCGRYPDAHGQTQGYSHLLQRVP